MSLIKDKALQVGRQLQNLLDRSAEDMQQLPEMTASTLPEAGWPCEPTLTLPPALPCQLTHRCPAGVKRGVAVPAGMSRRVRGPLLEVWGELATGRGALLLLQNQRQEAVAGNRKHTGTGKQFLSSMT